MWREMTGSAHARWVLLGLASVGLIALGFTAGCGGSGGDGGGQQVLQLVLTQIADGFQRPNYVTSAGDRSGRLFVVEQRGMIWIVDPTGQVLASPFLDLSNVVNDFGEGGLLSVAFHPDYENNGRLFVYYVATDGADIKSYIAEFEVSANNANEVDDGSQQVLLEIDQASYFHNGGLVTFGPEGYLWCGLGDGGNATRPNAQDPSDLIGALLRIDVDGGTPYAIPASNPFVGQGGARDEIYAYGFRNPWRYSIDPTTARVFVADVGQDDWEEINIVEAGGNYGWPTMEGPDCFPPGTNCDTTGLELPIFQYAHGQGGVCAVTGGYVYRGNRYPQLRGVYFYADYCAGTIHRLTEDNGQWTAALELDTDLQINSFGVDEDGEMYVVDLNGAVYRMDFQAQ